MTTVLLNFETVHVVGATATLNWRKRVWSPAGHSLRWKGGFPLRRRARVAFPNSVGPPRQGLVSPMGLLIATLPHVQHHTTPLPPAKEWEEWIALWQEPMNPENSMGATAGRSL